MASFSNQATLTYNGQTVSSNLVTGQVISPLTLTKTAGEDAYAPGDTLSYVISLVNDGSVTYEGLTLTDDLGGYEVGSGTAYPLAYVPDSVRYFINGVPQPAPAVTPGPPLTVTGLSVPAGGNAMLVYETEVTAAAPLMAGSAITNTAAVSGAGLTNALEAEASIAVESAAELSILKSLSPATVPENGQLTYTFLLQNRGNQEAGQAAGVTVSDLFDPVLKNISVSLNGQPLALSTGYSYNQTSGQFDSVPGVITVPAAAYAQSASTGDWIVSPGEAVLTVTGTV
ncbi:MAG: DUF11 domain-containing protein [Oscillospiraceae bacterium]|nr:DUF11 domain-containing protein [Oscillospiraceae bacterium]